MTTDSPGAADSSSPDPTPPASRLQALLFTDIVDSTGIKARAGTLAYTSSLQRHNAIFETALASSPGSKLIKHTGDGFFAAFSTASEAVRCALHFQRNLAAESWTAEPLHVRVGIHLGEAAMVRMADRTDIVGSPVDATARIMSLASAGQILLSRSAADEARRFITGESVGWTRHGRYKLKGVDSLLEIWEVADAATIALPAPPGAIDMGDSSGVPPPSDRPQRIGPYRILELLGEGGMGVVYKAEQRQPVRRIVALKVIKLGMDSKEVVARFEAERQALAMLAHPNVAKVFEAGTTDRGRPYFAMEHVPGLPINQYCDQNKMTTRQRLELFIPVCHAVQHAHQKGIIHRDLKPSNLLVSLFDGKPMAKVIDFGIAKATNAALTQHTLFTQTGAMIGTPEYMSPEQAMTSGLDVDTRTDVYSLGVVLYELLTGTLPFDKESLRTGSLEAMAQFIKNTEPHKPSTRLTRLRRATLPESAGQAQQIAECHHTDLRTLKREVVGDLDWIVLKAMQKDRTRRYDTASTLAMDLRRHLDDEPVSARPPSTLYRVGKFTRKHKALVAATAAVLLVLLLGIVGTSVGMVRAVRAHRAEAQERQRAQNAAALAEQQSRRAEANEAVAAKEAAKAKAVSGFLQEMLLALSPENAKSPTVYVRQFLDDAIRRLQAGALASQPDAEAAALLTLGKIYTLMDLPAQAVTHLRRALELQKQLHGHEDHADLAVTMTHLSDALMRSGDLDAAEPMIADAVAMNRRLHSKDDADLALSLNVMGNMMLRRNKPSLAEGIYRESLEMRRRLFGESQEVATTLQNLAIVIKEKGEFPASEAMWNEALAMYRKVLGNDHPRLTYPLGNLAGLALDRGDFAAADRYLSEALAIHRKVLGGNHPQVVADLLTLFDARRDKGDRAGMELAAHELVDITRKSLQKESKEIIGNPNEVTFRLFYFLDEYGLAETVIQEYDAKLQSMDSPSAEASLAVAYEFLSLYRRSHNEPKLAEWQAKQAKRFDLVIKQDTSAIYLHPDDESLYYNRARRYAGQGKFNDAAGDYAKAMELKPDDIRPWTARGCLLAYLGDEPGWRAHCTRMLAKFGDSDTDVILDMTAKTSLLLPGNDAKRALALIDKALTKVAPGNIGSQCWFSFCKSLACYRLGDFKHSLEWAEKARILGGERPDVRSTTIDLILAMAHYQLHEQEESHLALARARQKINEDLTLLGKGNLNWDGPEDWLNCQTFLRQAESLIPMDHR